MRLSILFLASSVALGCRVTVADRTTTKSAETDAVEDIAGTIDQDGGFQLAEVERNDVALADDEEASAEAVMSLLDEAFEALGEVDGGNSDDMDGALNLVDDVDITASRSRDQKCEEMEDKKARVTVTGKNRRTVVRESSVRKMTYIEKGDFGSTRAWKFGAPQAARDVNCAADKKHAAIAWRENVAGLTQGSKSHSVRSEKRTVRIKATDVTHVKTLLVSSKSARNTHWRSESREANSNNILRRQIISSNHQRQIVRTDTRPGADVRNLFSVESKATDPFNILVVRHATSFQLLSKTIVKGTRIARRNGDGRIEMEFNNLKLLINEEAETCEETSGSLDVRYYRNTDINPTRKYRVTYAAGVATVVDLATGQTVTIDLDLPSCAAGLFRG